MGSLLGPVSRSSLELRIRIFFLMSDEGSESEEEEQQLLLLEEEEEMACPTPLSTKLGMMLVYRLPME